MSAGDPACRSCEAPIIWAQTPKGKAIPLDPEPDPNGNIELSDSKVVPGEKFARTLKRDELAQAQTEGRELHISHFATCPNARRHRRR